MFDATQLDRRQLLGTGAGLLAFTAFPAHARRGRFNNLGWGKVQAMLDAYVADDRLPGAVGAIARGTDDASFLFSGKIARGETRAMDADSLFRVYSMTKPITGIALWIEQDGHVWLVRRPAKGLLGGMRALPGGGWDGTDCPETGQILGAVTHGFTHFNLTLAVHKSSCALQPSGEWWPIARIDDAGLPTVFAKAAKLAIRETDYVRRDAA